MRHKIASGLIAASLVVGASFAWLWHQEHRSERVLVLASGPRLSEYHDFAQALSHVVAALEPRLNIRVIETFGSEARLSGWVFLDGVHGVDSTGVRAFGDVHRTRGEEQHRAPQK